VGLISVIPLHIAFTVIPYIGSQPITELANAHDVYEVNGVVWSKRWDKDKKSDTDGMIVSAGDDGSVNFIPSSKSS